MEPEQPNQTEADLAKLLASIVANQQAMYERIQRIEADHEGIKAGLGALDRATAGALVMLQRHDDTLKAITVPAAPATPKKTVLN